ncbi:uncharacterized protein RJT21DRAFT_136367 [Scheffersomyces amazonensis]|uniref:uncharacterized protein n=1 Tax=Scheffersomyces amazonensis TaxID=1078765 RepID=UPI00315D49A0
MEKTSQINRYAPFWRYLHIVIALEKCHQYDYARPSSYLEDNSTVFRIISDENFRNQSAKKLSGSVRVKTDVYDDSPLVEDDPKYWEDKFKPFHEYLENTFPIVWKHFKIETANTWGLIITWEGSSSLKPILLTAHQDVVPTQDNTIKDWTYPPYEGVFDGEKVWGRGAADCKNLLIGLLEAAEELYKSGFRPRRSVIFGFGFDEEIGGPRGAGSIAEILIERYGKDSFYAVVDEGGQSLAYENDVLLALPGTGEKGSTDVIIGLNTPGGHSSVPPDHTSIGIISQLIEEIENNPFNAFFTPVNPTFHEYQCIAVYSPSLDPKIRVDILRSEYDENSKKQAIKYLHDKSLLSRYLITTTQAIDIIHGGAKSNALPEYVEIDINHRVAIESNTDYVVSKDLNHVKYIAEKFDLGIVFNGEEIRAKTPKGYFTVEKVSELEPAPITPTTGKTWELFSGTIRHVYEEIAFADPKSEYHGKTVVVAPGIATGNTDTRYYWDLTKHIFRYRPGASTTVEAHAHGVNEVIPISSHLQLIAFYYEYLQLIDSVED